MFQLSFAKSFHTQRRLDNNVDSVSRRMGLERQAVPASPFETLVASPSSFGSDARPADAPFLRPRFECAGQDVGRRSRPCCKPWAAQQLSPGRPRGPCTPVSPVARPVSLPPGAEPRAEGPPPGESDGAACGPVLGLSTGAVGFPDTRGGKRGAWWELPSQSSGGGFRARRIPG